MARLTSLQWALFSLLLTFGCTTNKSSVPSSLGDIHFTVTGKKEAQPFFEKGLLLLHSFEYADAAEQFSKAKALDPGFAMAYWGEAMTHNHSLWRYLNFDKAGAILRELGPTPEERVAKAKSGIEKDFIKAVNILYSKGSMSDVYSRYAKWMGELYKKYPGNNEVAAFYSLSLIGSVIEGRNEKIYEQGAQIAKEILARNPRHPGALHYLIHAYDDPAHAQQAMTTADKYATVAPEAGHALHMPTHIYLALGIWDKVISSNIAAWQASVNRKVRKGLTEAALNYHSYHWLQYGYLQQGKIEVAKEMVEKMKTYAGLISTPPVRTHMIYLKTTYMVDANDYVGLASDIEVKQDDLNIVTRSMNYFARGMKAFYKKDEAQLEGIIQKLSAERLVDKARAEGGISVCGNVSGEKPTLLDVQQSEVMELELKAMHALLKGNSSLTEQLLKQAVSLESSISYAYGPPTIVKPSSELYGEWLLQTGKAKEALIQFELSLKAAPKRALSEKGKQRALTMIG